MIPALRKRHRRIWLLFAIGLPILFVTTYLRIPASAYDEFPINVEDALPQIKGMVETDQLKIQIRSDGIKDQLEIIIKMPLAQPNAFVYDGENSYLGKLGSKGVYRFILANNAVGDSFTVRIDDQIKNSSANFEISL